MSTAAKSTSQTVATDKAKEFWLLYPSSNSDTTLDDTLCALYYLPENYKLLILTDGVTKSNWPMTSYDELKTRIKLEDETGMTQKVSPFSFDHALISDDATPDIIKKTIKSQVIVSSGTKSDLEPAERNSFTVSANNPPALASAVLRIAHAA